MGKRINPRKQHYWYKALLLGLFFSAAFFIPYIVLGDGYFLYYGDFNVQQVPFYRAVHDAVRSGNFGWMHNTDLGTSLIGSYTFYLLGSPFFWLTLPFPSEFVPYLMGPLLILKFGTASLTGYIYLRRYVRDKNYAVIGGLLYAFSGYSVYNVFFNHFHEAIVVFPLLLAAIDEYMDRKRRGVVALAVFAACFMNYYFFVGMVAFVIIYWSLRMYSGMWKLSMRDFLALALEVVLGFAMTAVILVPTVLFVTQNPRLNDWPHGWGALLYSSEQRYLHIFTSLFFPPDIPARPNFTPDSNSKWASIAAWLPTFGMVGVIAFLQSKSKSWLKKLLPFLFVCTAIPILNAIFQLFVMSYYARWFYMLTLMMSLATIMALENSKADFKRAINLTLLITMSVAVGIGLMPNDNEGEPEGILDNIGLEEFPERFWTYTAIAMVSLSVATLLISSLKRSRKSFYPKAVICVGLIASIYAGYIIGLGRTHSYEMQEFIIPNVINQTESLGLDDINDVRSDFFETMDNVGLFWQIPNIQCFHSIVPGSIYEFYPSVGVTRDVGSRPEPKYYGLRSLLSVKYVFDYANDSDYFMNDENKTRMPGYKLIGKKNDFNIFENKNYIPYGFYYDSYITESQYYEISEENRHLALLKAMVIKDEEADRLGGTMTQLDDPRALSYNQFSYAKDCTTLKTHTCSKFKMGQSKFTAEITTPTGGDKLIFFSIPYEKGWSAKVNGEPADVEKVNIGFMAVKVPGGRMSKIEFEYHVPGLFAGIIVSAAAFVLFILYLIVSAKSGKLVPMPKLKKQYKVSAVGSADELGERYKRLVAGRDPMKRGPTFKTEKNAEFNNAIKALDKTINGLEEPEKDSHDDVNVDSAPTAEFSKKSETKTTSEVEPEEDSDVKIYNKAPTKFYTTDGIVIGDLTSKVDNAKTVDIFKEDETKHYHRKHKKE